MGPPALGQTIAVVDKSGKVISTSKTLLAVFKEAKAAYRERKAEIVAVRQAERNNVQARRALQEFSLNDNGSRASSHGSGRRNSKSSSKSNTYHQDRHRSKSYHEGDREGGTSPRRRIASVPNLEDMSPPHPDLVRRHTEQQVRRKPVASRAASFSDQTVDMDLAYGDLPPPVPRAANEEDLRGLMLKVNTLLDEAHCLQHSVTTIISSLQRNPDALAAVALTLAEISQIASKLAPGALTALKGSFPAVIALLASPQFMIAAGVGVGVVVVALGGYKIIKKIKARSDANKEEPMAELQELGPDVNRIESWRRGIVPVEAESLGTSVDGEFITPEAAALRLGEERQAERKGRSRSRSVSHVSTKTKKDKKDKDGKSRDKAAKKDKDSEKKRLALTEKGSSRKGSSSSVSGLGNTKSRPKEKRQQSGLRMLLN